MNSSEEYIDYRIKRSNELLEDAILLADKKRWSSSVNRLYYSCFHIVNALMYKEGANAKTHDGLKTLFFKTFIKTGKIEKHFGILYSKLVDWRQESDYSIYVEFKEDDIIPLISEVEHFIAEIKKHL